jgi:hypothetical protein
MPVLVFLSVAGSVLVALLFLADATLEKNSQPAIVTSQRSGLPEPPRPVQEIQILTSVPAPAPDMTSRAVLDAQPKSVVLTKVGSEAGEALAEAPSRGTSVTPPVRRNSGTQLVDRFSIGGQ